MIGLGQAATRPRSSAPSVPMRALLDCRGYAPTFHMALNVLQRFKLDVRMHWNSLFVRAYLRF